MDAAVTPGAFVAGGVTLTPVNFLGYDTSATPGASGYKNAWGSSDKLIYNKGGNNAELTSTAAFDLTSADFVGGWLDGLSVTVYGYTTDLTNAAYSQTFTVNTTSATSEIFDWLDLTKLVISTSAGSLTPGRGWSTTSKQVGIDNLNVSLSEQSSSAVPEAATWAMMLGGFGMVGFAMRSRRRVSFAI